MLIFPDPIVKFALVKSSKRLISISLTPKVCRLEKTAAAPTAATATVSGRLRDINGKPAARVAVTIANVATGEVLSTRTDLFGRYSFTELPTGEDYLLRVFSRRHAFGVNEILINLLEDLTNANFTIGSGK